MRKRNWKKVQAFSLDEAIQLTAEYADEIARRPAKVMADLMGVELKTYYRWLAESSMPLHRVRQFEAFSGCHFISDYLAVASGRVVIAVPMGRASKANDLLEMQATFTDAMSQLVRFYQHGSGLEDTVSALTATLNQLAWQRENVSKAASPELALFERGEA
ncbi:hypothetical protein [Jeongeupia chitinilytica]|uniref:Uncharacterized protein n=1 Tax=Jeongeupia chitinilytica TaxID=1041641 RepID=A0ABQ3H0T7_9NEIS|nr:hypothetical protein [Jeongeupia chitinilytica]GHD63740.1 hypothetical protein GCM10007350_21830 [Jeongeupia chitinilytica]